MFFIQNVSFGFVIGVLSFVTSLHVTRGGCTVFFVLSLLSPLSALTSKEGPLSNAQP